MIAAVEASDIPPDEAQRAAAELAADPRGAEAAAAAGAADAALRALQALSAASAGAAAGTVGGFQAAGGGGMLLPMAGGVGAAAPSATAAVAVKTEGKRRGGNKQQHQQQQQGAAPDAWMGDVGQSTQLLLARLGLSQHQHLLDAAGCDLAALRLMGERHLLALGLPLGAVVKLRAALGDAGGGGGGGGG
jgi:hypothetical protein